MNCDIVKIVLIFINDILLLINNINNIIQY